MSIWWISFATDQPTAGHVRSKNSPIASSATGSTTRYHTRGEGARARHRIGCRVSVFYLGEVPRGTGQSIPTRHRAVETRRDGMNGKREGILSSLGALEIEDG